MAVEMVVDCLQVDPLRQAQVVVLKEAAAERYLPIAIGPAEAVAIAVKLMGADVPRPLAHDLIGATVRALGGRVQRVLIHAVVDGVFRARVELAASGRDLEVDSRPSDAIALAMRLHAPILVEEAVLARHALVPNQRAPGRAAEAAGPAGERVRDEQLAAFREVVERLDLDDLGRR
jgi:bifunctional DNase/RNase